MPSKESNNRYWLAIIMLLIVSGSHIGMVWLNIVYSLSGRQESIITLESIFGIVAIALFSFLFIVRKNIEKVGLPQPIILFLAFSILSALSEIYKMGSFSQLANINIFFALFINLMMGFTISRDIISQELKIPYLNWLLFIYSIWYISLIIFFINGSLGFYDQFSASGEIKERLSFLSGYSATEIPIYVGFHLPIILYSLLTASKKIVKLWSIVLLLFSLYLSYLSLSSAVFFALILVFSVFYATVYGMRATNFILLIGITTILIISGSIAIPGLLDATLLKFEDAQAGEGRGSLYLTLVDAIFNHPYGLGLAQFVNYPKNNFEAFGAGSYPHNNILGIGAELGIISLIVYFLFIVSSITILMKTAFKNNNNNLPLELRLLAAIGLSVFLFQQFRGCFHDTWTFKELYFWLGIGLGIEKNNITKMSIISRKQ